MYIEDILKMPNGEEKAKQLAISGLLFDGGHHKQWFLERIIEALGYSLDDVRRESDKENGYGGEWGFWTESTHPELKEEYIKRGLQALGYNLDEVREGRKWAEGIAP